MALDDIRRWYHVREGYWFAPKLFGFGATPVTWQGWALTLGFCAALLLDIRFLPGDLLKAIVGVTLAAGFVTISWRKTDGGWRWRWGSRA
ncbi:MAG: hypothetical protein V4610_17525 [Pseudomonadota bacterium]|uniref:Uncharacterized protein n=1 Tax=hydrothermal vent metagenome TaxID=652676 RepID=A0A160TN94_9ZZZZ